MHSTNYTLLYTLAVTAIPAVLLASMFTFLKPIHDTNEAIYNKKQILSSLNQELSTDEKAFKAENLSDSEIDTYFADAVMTQFVVDANGKTVDAADHYGDKALDISMEKEEKKALKDRHYPVFIYNKDGKKYYILSIRGNGLWDKIWGWIAIKDDMNTIAGASFGHKGETPGLGAEIKDNTSWKNKFQGKKIFNQAGEIAVNVRKGGAQDAAYDVDGISGATVTCDGVSDMLKTGIGAYLPYLKTVK